MPVSAIHYLLTLQRQGQLHRLVLVKAEGGVDLPIEPSSTASFDPKTLTLSLSGNRRALRADGGDRALFFQPLFNQGWQQIYMDRGLQRASLLWHSDRSLVLKTYYAANSSRLNYHVMEHAKGYCQLSLLLKMGDIINYFVRVGAHVEQLQSCTDLLLSIFKQILSVVDQMHRNGICHNNLFAKKVLIDCRHLELWPEFARWMESHQQNHPGSELQRNFQYGLSHAEPLLQLFIFEQNDLMRVVLLMLSVGGVLKKGLKVDLSKLLSLVQPMLLEIQRGLRVSAAPIKICNFTHLSRMPDGIGSKASCAEISKDLAFMRSIILHALLKTPRVPCGPVPYGHLFLNKNRGVLLSSYPELAGHQSYLRLAFLLSTIESQDDTVRIEHVINEIRRMLCSEIKDESEQRQLGGPVQL